MASNREGTASPSASWSTWESESADDDMDFELASETSTAMSPSVEDENDTETEGTTLYFDAEEGTLRTSDGREVEIEDDSNEEASESQEADEEEEEGDGSRTPQPAAERARPAQTFTSMSTSTTTTPAAVVPEASRPRRRNFIRRLSSGTQHRMLQILAHAGFRGILGSGGGATTRSQTRRRQALDDDDDEQPDDEDEYDSDAYLGYGARRSRRTRRPFVGDRYPPIPSKEGKELMDSGTFGTNDHCSHSACGLPFSQNHAHKRAKLSRRMLDREIGASIRARTLSNLAAQTLIPSSKADLIINLNARCYSGQFSEDGSFFFACGQDFRVRMYDTSNPYDWKYYKTVNYYGGQWTITDASLSPDNKLLAYSSIRSQVCLANTDQNDDSEPRLLDFADTGSRHRQTHGRGGWGGGHGHFGIWSLRFSGDGNEIVAGTSDQSVYVYDLEAQRSILRIPGHSDDVNAVCFGDKMSPHILYSGSDDTTLKVWDRRSLASMRPAGAFLGHTEGLTYIDSKGDGRYVISNGKDQTCKLWDLRKMVSTDKLDTIDPQQFTNHFDYRFSPYDTASHTPHPHDCSLVTFRGHRVLKTLIRCHFSPASSTDGRYIYSGSHDGKIYIWNLDGTEAGTINVLKATKDTRPQSDERFVERYDYYGNGGVWKTIVRDCSWHPSAPVIAATSWNGWDHGLGTCTVHSWSDGADGDEVGDGAADGVEGWGAALATGEKRRALGATPMGARVTAQLGHDERFYNTQAAGTRDVRRTRLRDRMGLGALRGDDE